MESSQGNSYSVLDFLWTVACRSLHSPLQLPEQLFFASRDYLHATAGWLHKIRLLSCSKYVTVISGELVFKILNERVNGS